MFKIDNLVIENFQRLKDVRISLMNLGLVLLKGRNMDEKNKGSSGAGKTLFGDSIMWLLGGTTSRKIPADSVIGDSGKGCMVSAIIINDDKEYELSRYRKHEKYGNSVVFCSGNDLSHRKVAETEDRLRTVIGCSFDLLRVSTFVGGDYKMMFSRMDPETRAKILDEIVDTDEANIGHRYKEVGRLISESDNEMRDIEAKIRELEINIENERNALINTESDIKNFNSQKQDMLIVPKPKYDYNSKINSLKESLKEFLKAKENDNKKRIEIRKLENTIINLKERYRIKKNIYDKLNSGIYNIGDKCPTCSEIINSRSLKYINSSTDSDIKKTGEELELISGEIKNNESAIAKVGIPDDYLQNKFTEVEKQIQICEDESKHYNSEVAIVNSMNEKIRKTNEGGAEQISIMKKRSEESRKKISELKQKLSIFKIHLTKIRRMGYNYETIHGFYSPSGLRPMVMRHYAPVISDFSNQYLTFLIGGSEKIDIKTKQSGADGKEKIDVSVSQNGDRRVFPNEFSRGECQAIDLSMGFGLMDLASAKAGKQFGLRYFDESFDGLPMELVERFFDMLLNRIYKKGMTIICTTHRPVKENYFNHIWCAVKENGITRIEVEK